MAGEAGSGTGALDGVVALPGVFEAVEAARGSTDALLRDLLKPPLRGRVAELVAEAVRRGAWASAALEGAPGAVDTFVPPFPSDGHRALRHAALRVTTEVGGLVPVWQRAPLQALARLASVAGAGLAPDAELGRPRAEPQVSARLAALAATVVAPGQPPAVVVAAVVHGELLSLEPFAAANGLVARAASRLVLVAGGLDPRGVVIPEAGHLQLGAEAYRRALDGYRTGQPDGVAAWVSHCAQAVALGARAARSVAAGLAAS
jgi:hypothetical protein